MCKTAPSVSKACELGLLESTQERARNENAAQWAISHCCCNPGGFLLLTRTLCVRMSHPWTEPNSSAEDETRSVLSSSPLYPTGNGTKRAVSTAAFYEAWQWRGARGFPSGWLKSSPFETGWQRATRSNSTEWGTTTPSEEEAKVGLFSIRPDQGSLWLPIRSNTNNQIKATCQKQICPRAAEIQRTGLLRVRL